MIPAQQSSASDIRTKVRNVFFILLGSAVLAFKQQYTGPLRQTVHAYAGNLSVSFAVYFVCANLPIQTKIKRLSAALLALLSVESFEAFNGFGVMANTYDPIDFIVNAIGVAFTSALDTVLARISATQVRTKSM